MQSSFWGRFRRGFGWVPIRIVVRGPYAQPPPAAQVLLRRIPFSPYTVGYVPRGPLFDFENEGALAAIVEGLDWLAKRVRAISITVELPETRDPLLGPRMQRFGLRPAKPVQHISTRVLDISPSLDQLQGQWKPKWRYNTRLAAKHGVSAREARDEADYARWYGLMRDTSVRDRFTIRSEEYYHRFWLQGRREGTTVLLLAEHENRLLAGIIVHHFGDEATYLYGASSSESRNVMAPQFLQWEAMQWARARGAKHYDLFGIASTDDEHDPLAGVTRFKAGYGGKVVHYGGAFDRIYHPLLYAAMQRARARSVG